MSGVTRRRVPAAGVLFIRSLGGLSKQETAARGNLYGMIGMALAVRRRRRRLASRRAMDGSAPGCALLVGAVVVGAVIGAVLARRVEMTGMPELVAILHSFVGLAAVLVGISSLPGARAARARARRVRAHIVHMRGDLGRRGGRRAHVHRLDHRLGKLRGTISGKPLLLPGRHLLNAVIAAGASSGWRCRSARPTGRRAGCCGCWS